MTTINYPTLEHVAMEARPYPTRVLEGAETGLVLFAAAFLGHNDAIHFAEAGARGFCVDRDGERLAQMARLYPDDWQWAVDDVWKFAEAARTLGEQWDVVSADPWTDAFQAVADRAELLCSLARRAVTIGTGARTNVTPPAGWRITEVVERSSFRGGVNWTVLERC
jgi:hypothetical protein